MDSYIDLNIRNFFSSRKDIFGENSEFLRLNVNKKIISGEGDNSTVILATVEYKLGNEIRVSDPLCLKLMPSVINYEGGTSYSFMNEMFFHSKMVKFWKAVNLPCNLFPKFYNGFLDMNGKEEHALLILENVQTKGYVNAEQKSFLDFAHLSLMMRKLGEFHALSYKAKKVDLNRFLSLSVAFSPTIASACTELEAVSNKIANRAFDNLRKDPKYSGRLSFISGIMECLTQNLLKHLRNGPSNPISVLCHFSYSRNNVLFRYENGVPVDLKFIDMTFCAVASPGTDISYVLYINADQRMRDEHFDDLIDQYFKGLYSICSPDEVPPKDSIMKETSDLGWVYGCVMSLTFVPLAIAREKMTNSEQNQIIQQMLKSDMENKSNSENKSNNKLAVLLEKVSNFFGTHELILILKDCIDRNII